VTKISLNGVRRSKVDWKSFLGLALKFKLGSIDGSGGVGTVRDGVRKRGKQVGVYMSTKEEWEAKFRGILAVGGGWY